MAIKNVVLLGADLLIIAVKYGALRDILDDVKAIITDDTIVLCPMNGVDSEAILSTVIPEKNIIYSIIKIASNRKGNDIRFDGAKHNIPVPYCEFCFHAIKALEEKNDGKFDY